MTTQNQHHQNKSGFVCPSCRMVFSLPLGMDGNGVSCPGCDNLLTIPAREDGVSILGVSQSKYNKVNPKDTNRDVVTHNNTLAEGENNEWPDSKLAHDGGLKIMIPIAVLSLLLMGGLAYFLFMGNDDVGHKPASIVGAATSLENDDDGSDQKVADVKVAQEIYIYNSKNKEQVTELEEFLTGLFEAKTVDEMLPYVRPVENIREKMVKFYKNETLSQSTFKDLSYAVNTPDYPGYLSVVVQTKDYNNHEAILKYSKDKILLDWESFVAYSDMSWGELAEKKPTDAVRVRVTSKRAFYYNDEFTDETKWQAVSLVSPNEKDSIYGYVEKGSAASELLFNFGLSDNRKVILDVRFPEGAKKGNQVFIDSVVQQGWVIKDKEEK